MRHFILTLFATIIFISTNAQIADYETSKLLNRKDFFELEKVFPSLKDDIKSPVLKLLATSFIHYHFNRPEEAYKSLINLLENYQSEMSFVDLHNALILLGNTMLQQNKFAETHTVFSNYLEILSPTLTDDKSKVIKNIIHNAGVLKKYPLQIIQTDNNIVKVPLEVKNSSLRIPVKIDNKTSKFAISTGLYHNVVSESFAKENNMNVTNDSIFISYINPGYYKIGFLKKIMIEEIIYYNPLFLIIPDSEKSNIGISEEAVFGIDFLKLVGETQILPLKNIIAFSKYDSPLPKSGINMMIANDLPIINVDWKEGKTTLNFNTESENAFYNNFYDSNKKWVEKNRKIDESSTNGLDKFTAETTYMIPTFKCTIGYKQFLIKNIKLKSSGANMAYANGSFGIDLILESHKVTINFNKMFINFE